MKKIILTIFGGVMMASFVLVPVYAQESGGNSSDSESVADAGNDTGLEKINNYAVEIKINQDASIDVKETIAYDFGSLQRHGIYRDIPFKYKARGGNFNLRLSNIKVTDERGQAYNFEVSNEGDQKRIKIGDADKLISGKKVYAISYRVGRAINYFDDHDELYWNAIGDQWSMEIKQASTVVTLPQKVDAKELRQQCFAGSRNTTNPCQQGEIVADSDGKSDTIKFEQNALGYYQGLTIVAGFPVGLVKKPTEMELFMETLKDNWSLGLPLISFMVLFYLWYTKGRDPEGKQTIIVQYDVPDNLIPAEVGAIMKEDVDNNFLSAEIVSLASRGYLKITRLEEKILFFKSTNYLLEQLKYTDDLDNEFERKLIKGLFKFGSKVSDRGGVIAEVKISDLKQKFYTKLEGLKNDIYQSVVKKGYFAENPSKTRGTYIGIGVVIVFGGFLGGLFIESWIMAVSLVVTGILIIFFGNIMPRRTLKGVQAKEYILGLKDYLKVAEEDRIKFHNAPEKSPKIFEKLLPVAMVLGVEKAWAKQFENIYNQPPSWYNDPTGANFNAIYFANSLGDFRSSADSSMTSAPSSASGGGSGFSGGGGGGFGGGGGGSW